MGNVGQASEKLESLVDRVVPVQIRHNALRFVCVWGSGFALKFRNVSDNACYFLQLKGFHVSHDTYKFRAVELRVSDSASPFF